MFSKFIEFVRNLYGTNDFIPLHEPRFGGNEKKYLIEAIDSTFVSSVGEFVNQFEKKICEYTGVKHAIATVNGTAALHVALKLVGVGPDTEVITQSLTFVATCNVIRYCGARPIFVDVDRVTLGLSPKSLKQFLVKFCEVRDTGGCWNKNTGRRISACLPMHTFGFPVNLKEIRKICDRFDIELIEDAAESFGSYFEGQHTGQVGKLSAISFNGNKIITTGGGGVILTNNEEMAIRAKHITCTSKIFHRWKLAHDEVGYNYRMPNINAALGVAQLESFPDYLVSKRRIAQQYQDWGLTNDMRFVEELPTMRANYWLNTVLTKDKATRDRLLEVTNSNNIMTRPAWVPMHKLAIYKNFECGDMTNTEWLAERIVNVPSSVLCHEN